MVGRCRPNGSLSERPCMLREIRSFTLLRSVSSGSCATNPFRMRGNEEARVISVAMQLVSQPMSPAASVKWSRSPESEIRLHPTWASAMAR